MLSFNEWFSSLDQFNLVNSNSTLYYFILKPMSTNYKKKKCLSLHANIVKKKNKDSCLKKQFLLVNFFPENINSKAKLEMIVNYKTEK